MEPGAERRIAAEFCELRECSDERVLRELTCEVGVARQAEGETEDPGRVRVVQVARCGPVTGEDPSDQVGLTHPVGCLKGNGCSGHVLAVRCGIRRKRS